ncbi:c-type cytochrome [Vitiosangium sp. GDMCC 1.1324]|uniref:c-type cytochrome n=1 Tax=Vitiosangium sp. (strain GDMCC 1.1324) TaxID=2138576 RepID=UPI000D394651|nr:c-type cytochrome [Vitiosangium sp. GDMCC 1.1324]PTL81781.1 cytochrome C [Vitiosangium sp. GDMCC 1.1324]
MKKVLWAALAVLLVGVLGAVGFVLGLRPRVRPAPSLKVVATPEKLARGRYLAENVSICFHCHSQADMSLFGTPPKPGSLGGGGMCMGPETGFPGTMCASNITPDSETGLGQWTDGELIRAIREGVSRDGRPLMPIMPYGLYKQMSDEDVEAIVAYLRTIPAIRNPIAQTRLDFPLSLIIRFMPEPVEQAIATPARSDTVAYGKYLVTVGGCVECHTPTDEQHNPLPGKLLAGGQEFELEKDAVVHSANITPHATGIGGLSREVFIGLFKRHAQPEARREVDPRFNTVMAWLSYAGMTDEDVGAIYDYLKTVPPVDNAVMAWTAPKVAAPASP